MNDLGRTGGDSGIGEGKGRQSQVGLGVGSGFMQGGLYWSRADTGMRLTELGKGWRRVRK